MPVSAAWRRMFGDALADQADAIEQRLRGRGINTAQREAEQRRLEAERRQAAAAKPDEETRKWWDT